MGKSTCSFSGCDKLMLAKGLCNGHYALRRKGIELRPLNPSPIRESPIERFWSKVNKNTENGCWEWTAHTTRGYGQFSAYGGMGSAHRFSWELTNGPIPDGMVIDHKCANKRCVNPDHLRVVTQGQNLQHFTRARIDSGSGVRGVTWDKRHRSWRAYARLNGQGYHGGYHSTLEAADAAARALRAQLYTHDDHDEWLRHNGRSA